MKLKRYDLALLDGHTTIVDTKQGPLANYRDALKWRRYWMRLMYELGRQQGLREAGATNET